MQKELKELDLHLEGNIKWDQLHKILFSTDASVYKRLPLAIAFPKTISDIQKIVGFANTNKLGLIPRAAGTSLAGQCVGDGIIVDISKHFTKILDLDIEKKTVKLQPGVNRDTLNLFLKEKGLFFGPNTSTSQFCLLGGMVGNNSSGTTSIQYGVTRDKVEELEVILSDGSVCNFRELSKEQIIEKTKAKSLEGSIYRQIIKILSNKSVQKSIVNDFPEASIHRRNTGYALDELLKMQPFSDDEIPLNLSKLLTGSEGTLAFTTSITLKLEDLPPSKSVMLVLHFDSISKSMKSVASLMKHNLYTCELIDKTILDCTKDHVGYSKNRFFLKGDPKAILLLELRNENLEELKKQLNKLEKQVEDDKLAYEYVSLWGEEIELANELRHAGLGLLGNIVGDKKAVACIEDTAVPLDKLADYIDEFQNLMERFKQNVVYYAHAGAGELHLRPILNLKSKKGIQDFRAITLSVAHLVKKYKGSLSGEHGDGIVRSEFIPIVVGDENYKTFKEIKKIFDSQNIFNPGKIIDPYPMDKYLRTRLGKSKNLDTAFDFSADHGLIRAAEKCNGAGNCRSVQPKGSMCPSYRATHDEKHNTRGRANVLREVLTNNKKPNVFDSLELKEVMDLCLSCKACATECPSSVDISTYKSEFLFQYKKKHGSSFRDMIFAYFGKLNSALEPIRFLQNFLFNTPVFDFLIKSSLEIAQSRSIQKLKKSLFKNLKKRRPNKSNRSVYLYLDEFTNYNDTEIGIDTIELMEGLGYRVNILPPSESGRTYISKGFLKQAKKCTDYNVALYHDKISFETPLLGIEPSAIYTFIDEYPKLASNKKDAKSLSKNCYTVEEFLAQEIKSGNIKASQFHNDNKEIKIHSHCYQKALGNQIDTFHILNLPKNYKVKMMNTGCCGMAGSFGYEKEHFEVSMKIGEERLFPSIRKTNSDTLIAANGTSCRNQILDGTQRESYHPVTILKKALLVKD